MSWRGFVESASYVRQTCIEARVITQGRLHQAVRDRLDRRRRGQTAGRPLVDSPPRPEQHATPPEDMSRQAARITFIDSSGRTVAVYKHISIMVHEGGVRYADMYRLVYHLRGHMFSPTWTIGSMESVRRSGQAMGMLVVMEARLPEGLAVAEGL